MLSLRLWLGVVTFLAGGVLWYVTLRERAIVPAWLRRLAAGVTALGFGTLAMTQPGLGWTLTSIVSSLVANVLILWVIAELFRKKKE